MSLFDSHVGIRLNSDFVDAVAVNIILDPFPLDLQSSFPYQSQHIAIVRRLQFILYIRGKMAFANVQSP